MAIFLLLDCQTNAYLMSQYRSCSYKKRRGFTFLEVLIATLLLCVLGEMVFNATQMLGRKHPFESSAKQLLSQLKLAQQVMIYGHSDLFVMLLQKPQGVQCSIKLCANQYHCAHLLQALGKEQERFLPQLRVATLSVGDSLSLSFLASQWATSKESLELQPIYLTQDDYDTHFYIHLQGLPYPLDLATEAQATSSTIPIPEGLQKRVRKALSAA